MEYFKRGRWVDGLITLAILGVVIIIVTQLVRHTALVAKFFPGYAPAGADARTLNAICQKQSTEPVQRKLCYVKLFYDIAAAKGPAVAFSYLRELQQYDPATISCHFIAHAIGEGAYKKDKKYWQENFQHINFGCSFGAYHGILTAYFKDVPASFPALMPTICSSSKSLMCQHILGHLAIVEKQGDTKEAIKLCSVFNGLPEAACIEGVFMEYVNPVILIQHGIVPGSWIDVPSRAEDIKRECESYSDPVAAYCWHASSQVSILSSGPDPDALFRFCNKASSLYGRKLCKLAGVSIIGERNNFNLEQVAFACKIPQLNYPEFEGDCYKELARMLAVNEPKAAERGVTFCTALDTKFIDACLSAIGNGLKSLSVSGERLRQVCGNLNKDQQQSCLGKDTGGDLPVHILEHEN